MSHQHEIKLFGAFRQYRDGRSVTVTLPENATVAALREAFAEQFEDDNARALLNASAFATDEAVLDDEERVPAGQRLSVLPPVCGG